MNNNFACVCVNIYDQLSQMLQNFQANSVGSGSETFTHGGGFGDSIPSSSSAQLGNPGRFGGEGGDNSSFTFAVILMMVALMFLIGQNNGNRITNEDQVKRPQNNNERRDRDFHDEQY